MAEIFLYAPAQRLTPCSLIGLVGKTHVNKLVSVRSCVNFEENGLHSRSQHIFFRFLTFLPRSFCCLITATFFIFNASDRLFHQHGRSGHLGRKKWCATRDKLPCQKGHVDWGNVSISYVLLIRKWLIRPTLMLSDMKVRSSFILLISRHFLSIAQTHL
jgi:hypothetical protein